MPNLLKYTQEYENSFNCPQDATTAIAVIGLGVSAAGAVAATSAQKDVLKAQERQSAMEARRARLAQVRESRIKRAQIAQQAASEGSLGGSGAVGGIGSLTSQTASNLGFISQQEAIQSDIFSAKSDMATAEGISSLGGSIYKSAPQISTLFN